MMQWKILLVDDDNDDWSFIREAMNVLTSDEVLEFVESGERALQILHEVHEQGMLPSLIVVDMNMPRMNGTQTLKRIKGDKLFSHIPVVIYSTSFNPTEQEKCRALGAQDFIKKPLSFTECIEVARLFLHYANEAHPV